MKRLNKLREIIKPNGEVYAKVAVENGQLRIQLTQAPHQPVVVFDAKVIPQLRQILTQAEFLNYV